MPTFAFVKLPVFITTSESVNRRGDVLNRICLSVCLSVLLKAISLKVIFDMQVPLQHRLV